MVDSKSPKAERLPIKLIMPKQGAEKKVKGGPPQTKPFCTVDDAYRKSLSNQVTAIHEALIPQMNQTVAAPVRVKLITKSVAKSHRPEQLFSSETCPIVSAGHLGELFVKATPQGLTKLKNIIENNQSERVTKELSCVETIEAVTPAFRRKGIEPNDVLRRSPRSEKGFMARVRLFNFGADQDQLRLVANFEETCRRRNISIRSDGYSSASFIYGTECHTVKDVDALSRVVGVRSIESMPLIRTIRPKMFNPEPLPKLPTRSEVPGDAPVVVVVDSGITSQIPELEEWVVGRESHVAPAYRNTDHGTFVAGLICWGSDLNPTIDGVDSNPCGVFDLQVIPNNDPSKGETESLREQEFLISLDMALQEHANKYKVWNLSLGTDVVCSLDEFSTFAEELDTLQEKYEVSFVISAGNYVSPPLLDFPREKLQLDAGRITTPADSVLGIAVGSISHVDYKKNGPKVHQPSAFSRHGAGPNYVIKPDLVHYGGSCSTDGAHIAGVRSVHSEGSAENMGTSFATPLVARHLHRSTIKLLQHQNLYSHGRFSHTTHATPEQGNESRTVKRISLALAYRHPSLTAWNVRHIRQHSFLTTIFVLTTFWNGMIFLIQLHFAAKDAILVKSG